MNFRREFLDRDISAQVRAALRAGGEIGQMEQHPDEIAPFAALVAEELRPAVVVEIGQRRGGTAGLWCALASARVVGVDLPAERQGHSRLLLAFPGKFVSILGDSHLPATVGAVRDALGAAPADLLFLDGDHALAGVEADFAAYAPLVRPGGLVAFHDIVDTPLTRKVNCRVCEFWQPLAGGEKREFNVGGDWGGIGVWRKPEGA